MSFFNLLIMSFWSILLIPNYQDKFQKLFTLYFTFFKLFVLKFFSEKAINISKYYK